MSIIAGRGRAITVALMAAGLGVGFAGCSSTLRTMPLIGEPSVVPAPPAEQPAYPPLAGPAADPSRRPMTPQERAKREAELAESRTRAVEERRRKIRGDE
jgi:hypothetical protein